MPARNIRRSTARHRSTPPSSASAFSSQKPISISRYIVAAVVRCSWAFAWSGGPTVERAEAEMAVGDEGAHAELGGAGEGPPVVLFGGPQVPKVGLHGNFAEETEDPRLVAALRLPVREVEGAPGDRTRVVSAAGHQMRLAEVGQEERVVGRCPSPRGRRAPPP